MYTCNTQLFPRFDAIVAVKIESEIIIRDYDRRKKKLGWIKKYELQGEKCLVQQILEQTTVYRTAVDRNAKPGEKQIVDLPMTDVLLELGVTLCA